MGNPTGFMKHQRVWPVSQLPQKRLQNFKEFEHSLEPEQAVVQGARCMDCGVPFCTNGCPVHNVIPDWNDLVYNQNWLAALQSLHATNNFPEFTGRICPAPCEEACTLAFNDQAVGIKSIERFIVDKGWEKGWIKPNVPLAQTGKTVAIVGSGPAGLACAQQLARVGHAVTVFEKNDRIGGLLRYGIPDFKLSKHLIDRRIEQMEAEGVVFKTGVLVGNLAEDYVNCLNSTVISVEELREKYDAVVLAAGSESPRDVIAPGRELKGIYYAMDYLVKQNRTVAGDESVENFISAESKHVVVIGGGDTGSDCVGTANRQGAASVTQLELMPKPSEDVDRALVWPNWPMKLRTSSSHEEGCTRDWGVMTKAFLGDQGRLTGLNLVRVDFVAGKFVEQADSMIELKADLVFLAVGFVHPVPQLLSLFDVETDARGNVLAKTDSSQAYQTSQEGVFAAGDVRRGQSLVVWAIREGRCCARAVDCFLQGDSVLPA